MTFKQECILQPQGGRATPPRLSDVHAWRAYIVYACVLGRAALDMAGASQAAAKVTLTGRDGVLGTWPLTPYGGEPWLNLAEAATRLTITVSSPQLPQVLELRMGRNSDGHEAGCVYVYSQGAKGKASRVALKKVLKGMLATATASHYHHLREEMTRDGEIILVPHDA